MEKSRPIYILRTYYGSNICPRIVLEQESVRSFSDKDEAMAVAIRMQEAGIIVSLTEISRKDDDHPE